MGSSEPDPLEQQFLPIVDDLWDVLYEQDMIHEWELQQEEQWREAEEYDEMIRREQAEADWQTRHITKIRHDDEPDIDYF